jgi:DHA2 family multidrug resistance protein
MASSAEPRATGGLQPAQRAEREAQARQDVTEYGLRRLLIVIGVMAATLMQTLDGTITNVALPTIQGNLGASQDEATWVVTGYTIAAITVIPLTPWLQDRFGRKRYYLASIIGFTIASVACGRSTTLPMLVFWRVVQGAFGGGLLATSQAILRDTFPPRQLGMSQAIFALGAIMGPSLGPPLGGILVDNATWNLCFDINVAPGLISSLLLYFLLRDPTAPRSRPVDFLGLALLATAIATLQYILTEGERHYWLADPTIDVMLALCIFSSASFIWYELHGTRDPIVDLRIFANRSVATGSLLGFALGAVVFGSTYTIPQVTQGPLGFTATLSGMLFLLRAGPIALFTPFAARLAGSLDVRWLLGAGFLTVAFGTALLAHVTTPLSDFWTFAPPLIVTGIGVAFLFTPISIAVLRATTPSEGPKAGAMVNLATQLGGSVSIAFLDVLVDRRMTFHSEVLQGSVTRANLQVQLFLHHGSPAELAQIVGTQAAVLAYADATWVMALLAGICTPLVLLMRRPRKGAAAP